MGIGLGSAWLWTKGVKITSAQRREIWKRYVERVFTPERRARQREVALSSLVPRLEKYSAEDLIKKITDFYEENGRIPLKREFNMYNEYKRRFGSWNAAIRLAGFRPNPIIFAYKFIAQDGHSCDSFTEKIVDDWLYSRGVEHERSVPYGKSKFTADFKILPNIVIEFFGLAGEQEAYDRNIEIKRNLCSELGWRLIELYPKDLFPRNQLSKILDISR